MCRVFKKNNLTRMEKVEDEQKQLDKKLIKAAVDAHALEQLDDKSVQETLKVREEWSMQRSLLAAKTLQTLGQLPYELAWGNDGGVADIISS